MNTPLGYMVLGFSCCVAVAGLTAAVWWLQRCWAAGMRLVAALEGVGAFGEAMRQLPRYIEGHSKTAAAMASEVTALRQVVKEFQAVLIAPQGYGKQALTFPDEAKASDWHDVQELLRTGMPRGDAEQQVGQEHEIRVAMGLE